MPGQLGFKARQSQKGKKLQRHNEGQHPKQSPAKPEPRGGEAASLAGLQASIPRRGDDAEQTQALSVLTPLFSTHMVLPWMGRSQAQRLGQFEKNA